MGIPAIFVVNPQTGIFEQFANGALKQQDSFSLAKPGIAFPFSEIANLVW